MTENTGLAVYMMYHALRLHFTSDSYDYIKYNGKTNVSANSFLSNKNKFSFYKLSRKYSVDDCRNFFVSNFIVGDTHWVGELLTPEAEENYKKWQKRNQSLTYQFEQDIIHLTDSSGNFLHVDNGTYPYLLEEVMRGDVMLETLVIMNDIMGFLPMWQKKIQDDVIWPEWHRRIVKYAPFVHYDKVKFKGILKEGLKMYV